MAVLVLLSSTGFASDDVVNCSSCTSPIEVGTRGFTELIPVVTSAINNGIIAVTVDVDDANGIRNTVTVTGDKNGNTTTTVTQNGDTKYFISSFYDPLCIDCDSQGL
ncbi:hypothetical protein [Thiolapillus brandeum]|nr:hypothetical protein [Thiolapillus brandeum]